MGYVHEGLKVINNGKGLFNTPPEPDMRKFTSKDIIYVNKNRDQGLDELFNKKNIQMSYSYMVLLLGIATFIYVQYSLYRSAGSCKI